MLPQINDESLIKFYEITISVSGVLFPIFQAILFFIVEKSFNRLEFSRQNLIKFYDKTGKIITSCLGYLIVQSIFQIIKFHGFSIGLLCAFTFMLVVFQLDLLKYTGYWNTLNSSHFIPSKANILRKYFITLWNNRFIEKLKFVIFLLLIYFPFTQSNSIFWSVFSILIYTLFQISILFNNPTFIQKKLLESENTSHELVEEDLKWSEEKIDREETIIKNTLLSSGYKIQEYSISDNFKYSINPFIKENGELHVNLRIIDLEINSIEDLKKQIYIIAKNLFILFANTTTDINSFVLSFLFEIDKKQKNVFIRSYKNEIQNNKDKQAQEFVYSLKNKLIDDVLK